MYLTTSEAQKMLQAAQAKYAVMKAAAANLAVNQTLVRSINTSLVALIPVGAILYVSIATLGSGPLKDLSLATALTIATTAADLCKSQGYTVSVAVVGRNGEVIVQMRGDNAPPHTVENSFRKAYSSRTYRVPSGELVKRLKDNPQAPFVYLSNVVAAQGVAQTEAHRLIERLMILTNEQVAQRLQRQRVPAIYRVHAQPDPARVGPASS